MSETPPLAEPGGEGEKRCQRASSILCVMCSSGCNQEIRRDFMGGLALDWALQGGPWGWHMRGCAGMSSETGKFEYVIFLRVIIVITTEHLACVDILSHSVPITQSGTFFL